MGIRNTREVASWMNAYENKKQQFKIEPPSRKASFYITIDPGGGRSTCIRRPVIGKGGIIEF